MLSTGTVWKPIGAVKPVANRTKYSMVPLSSNAVAVRDLDITEYVPGLRLSNLLPDTRYVRSTSPPAPTSQTR